MLHAISLTRSKRAQKQPGSKVSVFDFKTYVHDDCQLIPNPAVGILLLVVQDMNSKEWIFPTNGKSLGTDVFS